MKLEKTNVPGFMKDPKTGVIHNTDQTKIDMMKASRQQYKNSKNLEMRVTELEKRLAQLEENNKQIFINPPPGGWIKLDV